MPLVKYRTNEDKVNEIMVDNNITVSGFMDMINKKSTEKVTKSIFRGKVLDDDDLIRNHITGPDQVLILLTNKSDISNDVMDLDQGKEDNEKKKEVENNVASSFLNRTENNQIRKGFKYTFTIYTTATSDSMLHGNKINFNLNDDYSKCYDEIKKLISKFPKMNSKFDLYMFLPGGVYFNSGSLIDYYSSPENIAYDNIYVIVTRPSKKSYSVDDELKEPCSCSNQQRKEILSPICESSLAGLTQIASFLGYMFHNGPRSENILLSIAKVTRFAPLVVNLFRLIENRPLNSINILAITAPLFTLFRSMLPKQVKNENVFEYTLNFLSIFDLMTNTEYLKFFELNLLNEKECEEAKWLSDYCKKTEQQQHVIVWTVDTINPKFQSVLMNPDFLIIENIFSTVTTFKPVAPLSLHYIFYPTFLQGKTDKSVMLFIKEIPNKENIVLVIDPKEGYEKEINIEELATELNCNKKDDFFTLIDPNQVDQIIFICFDESQSMKWKLEGRNAKHNEKTRAILSTEFLNALVKQSYALRVSSFYGLISFSSEVKIRQPLTAMTSEFIQSLNKINPHGNTLLYDAINIAQQQIVNLVKGKNGKLKYPNSRLRIIVITDGVDNKSEKPPETLINELIKNEIVVDTVLVSLVDHSEGCCTISKLTGGLCFMPKNYEDGIKIFEQEAFLNIKIRHMTSIPYKEITSEIFLNEIKEFNNHYDSYAPNQMIIDAKSKVSLATPLYMSYISTKKIINSYRISRAFIELNIIGRNPNESFIVHSLYATPLEWRIFIKGPKNSPFKWLNLYMVLPSNYPIVPPRFRFLTIPFHPNVSSEGLVLFSLNDRNYNSSLGIDLIIIGIINLLSKPDKNYNLNKKAMELYTNDISEYKKVQKNGELGCDDYHEYLKDVKIYNEIPQNAVVPDKDRSQSNLIKLGKDAVNKAASKGGEIIDQCLLDINDYEMIRKLGSGGFGVVYLVIEKSTHNSFAAKIPKKSNDDEEIIDYIKEVNVISIFNHGAIAKMYGYCLKDFWGNDRRVIIMEYIPNGDLENVLMEEKKGIRRENWDDTQKLINLYGIASGMAYSASLGISHSDLKPANILMTDNLYPKITDFDSARLEIEEKQQSFNVSGNDISSPLYMPPESINDEITSIEKADVYSYSMIAYQVITGKTPFDGLGMMNLFKAVLKGQRPPLADGHYEDLIKSCWKQNPDERPTFQEIVDILKTDEFLEDKNIDKERFEKYVNYLNHYQESSTKNQIIHPKSKTDNKTDKGEEDAVTKLTKNILIIDLKNYDKKELLGEGRFTQVFRIVNKKDKSVLTARISKDESTNILREVNIMKNLNYPTVLKFVGYSSINFENEPKPTIITEYASIGSLQDIIDNKSKYREYNDTKRLIIIYGIVAGMNYLHEHSILHNDLKPSNILIDDQFHPKIADFGLSHSVNDSNNIADEFTTSKSVNIKGTPNYIAPEIWNEQGYAEATDMYSFGVLLYELVFLRKAFHGLKPIQVALKVNKDERPPFPVLTKQNAFKALIQRCWAQDPDKRPTFKQLMVELKDKKYISKDIDQKEYQEYIKYLQDFK